MHTKVYTYPHQTVITHAEKPGEANPTTYVFIDKNNNGTLDKEDIAIGVGEGISQMSPDCSTYGRLLNEGGPVKTNYCVRKIDDRVLKDRETMEKVRNLLKTAKAGREAISRVPPTTEGFCSDRVSRYSLWEIKFEPPLSLSTRKARVEQLITLSPNPSEHPEMIDPARCGVGYGVVKVKIDGAEVSAELYIHNDESDPLDDPDQKLSRRFGIFNDEGKMDASYWINDTGFFHVDLPRP